MIRKPFAAFGRVLYANYYEAGYKVDAATFAASKTVLLFTEGSFTARDKQTGEVVYQCDPGWYRNGEYQDGAYLCTSNVPSVSWCYDPNVNHDYVPPIDVLVVKQGKSTELPVGTALFLCTGTLVINNEKYVAPRQISVRSASATATALTDTYGLVFK
jgi:hypothetical protein